MAVKDMPPAFSRFHATIRTAISTNDGIRCFRKAEAFCKKVISGEKESRAKRLTKSIARIQRTLANHRSALPCVFI